MVLLLVTELAAAEFDLADRREGLGGHPGVEAAERRARGTAQGPAHLLAVVRLGREQLVVVGLRTAEEDALHGREDVGLIQQLDVEGGREAVGRAVYGGDPGHTGRGGGILGVGWRGGGSDRNRGTVLALTVKLYSMHTRQASITRRHLNNKTKNKLYCLYSMVLQKKT